MSDAIHQEFQEVCREAGWKCTSQRLAVYRFLQGNLTHPGVDAVWSAVRVSQPAITRESVYRILNEFAMRGLISRLDQIDNARYDSRTDVHGHFICERCGKIIDFDWPAETRIPRDFQAGSVARMEIRLVGVCESCASGDPPRNPEEAGTAEAPGGE